MKLLFITQKIHEQDDDLAFVTQWVDEFIKNDLDTQVLCLEKGEFDDRFPVYSLGKERGLGKIRRIINFYKFIFSHKYDYVFIHMNPEYFTLGGFWWKLQGSKMFLWYTHYTTHIHLKLAAFFSTYMFAATKQSLPQYDNNPKKTVTGHGVDVAYWQAANRCVNPQKLAMVHRLSRSKRIEIGIKALQLLPSEYTLDIYGRAIDPEYFSELQDLVTKLNVNDRVTFHGPLPMPKLRAVYPEHRIMINMASETIDKTMIEAMCSGVYPVTTPSNSEAIGLPEYPLADDPSSIAEFIKLQSPLKHSQTELVRIVQNKHSLSNLVRRMVEHFE